MAKDIITKAEILGGEIDVRANFGQTVKVTVSPDPYTGDTEVTPSDQTQVLQTKKKFVQDDITVHPAPTEALSTTSNGTFTPSSGKVGFSAVNVDVNPDLRPLSVSENGQYSPDEFDGYSDVTVDVEPNLTSLSVTENGLYLPESGVDGFDRVNVDVPVPSGSTTITQNGTYNVEQYASAVVDVPTTGYDKGALIYEGDFSATTSEWNVKTLPDGSAFSFDKIIVEISHVDGSTNGNWRNYWRSDLPMTGNHAQMIAIGSTLWRVDNSTDFDLTLTIEIDGAYINFLVTGQDNIDPTKAKAGLSVLANGGYDKITGYGWWFWALNAGAHIKITGYNRTA